MSTRVPRRTPKEFEFILRQLGQTHLLIVEGFSDRGFFRWLLDKRNHPALAIHCVEELEIPNSWVRDDDESYGNNRSLVVALCRASVDGHFAQNISVKGVIDRDCGVPEQWQSLPTLEVTDYPAIESHCLNPTTLEKWITVTLRADDEVSGGDIVRELSPILSGLFEVRRRFGGSLSLPVDKIAAHRQRHWQVSFRNAPDSEHRAEVFHNASPGDDPREKCYGHDLGILLMIRFAGRVKNQAGLSDLEGVERSLMGHLERSEIQGPLEQSLTAWRDSPAA